MTRQGWADKVKIIRYVLSDMSEDESSDMKPHPHGAWLYYHDYLKALNAEHARAVRIVKAKIKQVAIDEHSRTNAERLMCLGVLESVFTSITKGRR